MADPRFFTRSKAYTLKEIATHCGMTLPEGADKRQIIENVAPLQDAEITDISFLDNTKYVDVFTKSNAGACFVTAKYAVKAPEGMTVLVTDDPYAAYAKTAQLFYPASGAAAHIHPTSCIADTATIGEGCYIGPYVVIEDNVTVGRQCHIDAHTILHKGVSIDEGTRIGAHCSLSHTLVGSNVLLHRGVHIGQDGFGFAPTKEGLLKVPQLGRVIIEDEVEIGSNSCIDRGAGPDTIIGQGTKIDNLVQIGHNVQIGKYCVIVSQTGIAGSAVCEDGVMIGGQAGVAGHLTVGKGAKIASRAAVMHDVPAGETYCGAPAIPIKEFFRQLATLNKLTKQKNG